MQIAIDFDPEEAARAREVFNGMAMVYGFFFILLSAVVAMTSEFVIFINDTSIDFFTKHTGLFVFYGLVLFMGFGTAGFGAGLNETAAKMAVSKTFIQGLLIVTLTLPLFFTAMIGLLIRMPPILVLAESIIVEGSALYLTYTSLFKTKKYSIMTKASIVKFLRYVILPVFYVLVVYFGYWLITGLWIDFYWLVGLYVLFLMVHFPALYRYDNR